MAEKNPLLGSRQTESRGHIVSADESISSASVIVSEIPYPTTHPPAEIVSYTSPNHSVNHSPVQRQKHDDNNNTKRVIPRSPNSSRSRGDKVGNYNLEYTGKIPLASNFFFFVLIFGITLSLIAMGCSAYLTIDTQHGDKTTNHSDITNIVLPLIIYIMDIVECNLFYLEARTFQLRGYTQLFQDASKLSKINFRFISIYYVIAYSIYAFLYHHDPSYFSSPHDLDVIFLAIWYFSYVFIICCLCQFGHKFYIHNRDKPKPDLFFPHPNNNNYIQNSPLHRGQNKNVNMNKKININDDQTEVIQKLYKDKSTLMRQLDSMKKKYERTKNELHQLQQDTSSILGITPNTNYNGNINNAGNINGGNINNEVIELKNQIQKLRSKLRSEREQIKTLSTQIETKKTMLDAQISETQQLRNVLQAKDDRIAQLMNDKESLERGINACNDQKDDLLLLYQVKEQEVEIAKKENERLRLKNKQLTMQHVEHQNF